MTQHHDVVIVGGGLAGLSAARELSIHGVDVAVLERGETVGGRVRTDRIDGLQLDHGFQLYNPAYPEAARVLDHDALQLRAFTPGVVALTDHGPTRLGDPRRRPRWVVDALSGRTGGLAGKLRFTAYAWQTSRASRSDREDRQDMTAEVALLSAGVDAALMETVLRPFLSGVFLGTDCRRRGAFWTSSSPVSSRAHRPCQRPACRRYPSSSAIRCHRELSAAGCQSDQWRPAGSSPKAASSPLGP